MNTSEKPLLLLLAHAGGSVMMYRYLFSDIEKYFDILPLELPGHGKRLSEKLLYSLEEMNIDLVNQVREACPKPRACYIFGHSLGGQNAYLLAQSLSELGFLASECHLLISSTYTIGKYGFNAENLDLPMKEFWKESAKEFKSSNTKQFEDEQIMTLFAPVLHADLYAITKYEPQKAIEKHLDWPLTVIYAKNDTLTEKQVKEWRTYTSNSFTFKKVDGNHFYLLDNPYELIEIILKSLSQKRKY